MGMIGTAHAQALADCQAPQPPSLGAAVGRSLPYLELAPGAVDADRSTSESVQGGAQLAGRADLPVTGPVRARVEAATGRWDVRQRRYDANAGYQLTEDKSIGSMSARHLVAMIGIRTGRAPTCAHLSAGVGLYSIGFRETTLHRTGFALAGGIEIPAGRHGAVQADLTLHLIRIGDGSPLTNFSASPTLSLLLGWAYRF